MDPQLEKTPGLALPKPASERGDSVGVPPEMSVHPADTPPMMPPAVQMPIGTGQSGSHPVADPVTVSQPPAPADENTDALDEEWINKAKAVILQTKHDPHLESSELAKVKAEYLRIRYDKHIKTSDGQK